MTEELFPYTKVNVRKAIMKELDEYKKRYQPAQKPRAIVLGGQPGAGKSTLFQFFKNNMDRNMIEINGDEYRKYHPQFKKIREHFGSAYSQYTNQFSGEVTEGLIQALCDHKYNLLIEGTLRTTIVPLKTCTLLKENGYEVLLAVIIVKPVLSYLSTILREELMHMQGRAARATEQNAHDHIVHALADNLDYLYQENTFDAICLYNRESECLYDSRMDKMPPSIVVQQVFRGQWTQRELQEYDRLIGGIKALRKVDYFPELENLNNYFLPQER